MKRRMVVVGLLCLTPGVAHAHLVSTGFGAYYDGMAHLALTPHDWLVVVAMALLAGTSGRAAARAALIAFPAAWFLGGLAGTAVPSAGSLPVMTVLSFAVIALLVALGRPLPAAAITALASLAGLLHGFVNGATMVVAGRAWLALLGAATVVFVSATLLPAVVVSLRAHWARIVVRVVGSWIAAIGMLMLGWLVRAR